MASTTWPLLDKVRAQLGRAEDFPRQLVPLMAAKIEKTVCATSHKSLVELADDLSILLTDLIRLSPQDAVDAAHGELEVNPSLAAAFILGEVSFAQLLASQAATRRSGDEFLKPFHDKTSRRYINALSESELRNIELAAQLDVSEAHMSRTLKQLREEGIADFRRDGRDVYNFLTPAARAVLAGERASTNENVGKSNATGKQSHVHFAKSENDVIKRRTLEQALDKVDPSLREHATFGGVGLEREFA